MEIIKLENRDLFHKAVFRAVEVINKGGLLIFPTETVYGLAVAENNPAAIDRLYQLKGRDPNKPMARLVSHVGEIWPALKKAGRVAVKFALRFWPGPLTLVLERNGVTHGYRYPANPFGRSFLRACKTPVLATSANFSEEDSPRSIADIPPSLLNKVDLVIDDGQCEVGVPSTVVLIHENGKMEILRQGGIPEKVIRESALFTICFVCTGNTCRSPMAEALLRRMLIAKLHPAGGDLLRRNCRVISAGTDAFPGAPASEPSFAVMAERGLDLATHRSRSADFTTLADSDLVFTMTRSHRERILQMMPEAADRVFTLCAGDNDISDPFGGDLELYRKCASQIEQCIAKRMDMICALL